MIRTRFAPSPTGYLHIGGVRTALYSWAYARKYNGTFILRIEDTDLERSTPQSVQAILDGLAWLGLDYDEGPFYQTRRMPRYAEVIQKLVHDEHAYYCTCSKTELDVMREEQRKAGLKPRYNGRCRDLKILPGPGNAPVVRFKNPLDGAVVIDDMIKGRVVIGNQELDDLIIARQDGTPTYNFCVVVDDYDMQITHVIRGDDHLNNTPRQINILKALQAPLPQYAHVPMILGQDGERLSKRHGAVSVMQYKDDGFLPEALINYLARLGWSHGDTEIFSLAEFVAWFDITAVHKSAAKFDPEKLVWLNQEHIKNMPNADLAGRVIAFLPSMCDFSNPDLEGVVGLLKERAHTIKELAEAASAFYQIAPLSPELVAKHLDTQTLKYLGDLRPRLEVLDWERDKLHALLTQFIKEQGLSFAQIAIPLRIIILGSTQSPSIDAVLELIGKTETLKRMDRFLAPAA